MDGVEKKVSKEDNNPQLPGEAKSVMHDIIDLKAIHTTDQLGLDERVAMLNGDQRRIYNSVMNHLHHHNNKKNVKWRFFTSRCAHVNCVIMAMLYTHSIGNQP